MMNDWGSTLDAYTDEQLVEELRHRGWRDVAVEAHAAGATAVRMDVPVPDVGHILVPPGQVGHRVVTPTPVGWGA